MPLIAFFIRLATVAFAIGFFKFSSYFEKLSVMMI
ncbi:hypothetical protein MHA_2607 [Mannheimia haemolytica PHL213]|nr:hypothetical protein MHA_2607 [Mannheimia haemolytica PHL213]